MTSKKNGELPAFAVPLDMSKYHTDTGVFPAGCGLTKREYFAAMAMQGILSNRELQLALYNDISLYSKEGCTNHNCLAFHALREADELLKALES